MKNIVPPSLFTMPVFIILVSLSLNAPVAWASESGSPPASSQVASTSAAPDAISSADEEQIRALLESQAADWNRGDIDHFMEGYRKSDSTLFVGAQGVKRGWKAVMSRYKTDYPDRKAMGHLSFSKLEFHSMGVSSAFVVGEFDLLCADNSHKSGYFTLNLVKTGNRWEIVADHTSARA